MATLRLQIVTAERMTFDGEVDAVVAPGALGELGILPRHAPLLTKLGIGVLRARRGEGETVITLSGGFLEVCGNRVIVLADAAQRGDDLEAARARAARERAQTRLQETRTTVDATQAIEEMKRSLAQMRASRTRRRSGRDSGPRSS